MIIILEKHNYIDTLKAIEDRLQSLDLNYKMYEEEEKKIIVVGDKCLAAELASLQSLPGVERIVPVTKPYKLVSRQVKETDTIVNVQGIPIGGEHFQVIAGPCAVESKEQLFTVAKEVKKAGASLLRGGAYKPRTSPYSFQGLEEEGLKLLAQARELTGLPVVTEVVDARDVPKVAYYADMLQIGARNMHNYYLLKEAARQNKPILLKRGLSATIEEWLLAAEYILREGNTQVVLCERGIRTFENYTRNTLDLSAVAAVKHLSHLPVLVDPSHGTGKWFLVGPLAKAACPLGAHGLIIEVHDCPSAALSDGEQSLTPHNFQMLMKDIQELKKVCGKR